ncbi:MAG: aminoacyl-tRNA hydrolase [Patescibacteria group bacterium]
MKAIIGLGNPGKEYVSTRHNVGFLVVDALAKKMSVEFKAKRAIASEVAEAQLDDKRVLLVKPQTFMNVSGKSVAGVLTKYPVTQKELLVIYDDADLTFGDVRLKPGGSSAGHRGMESILSQFPKDTNIARLRIGIGRAENKEVPLDAFVLQPWSAKEAGKLPAIIDEAIKKIESYLGL